ncbi:MAG: hypothetical protein FVQ83_09490 [Chloroflexi bacterium]|nr:hypothetical protein [Chloroflexota bacterium]
MIIHPPEITHKNGEVIISAKVEFQNEISNIPNYLWYAYPEKYAPYVTLRSDGFLSAMLFPALHFQEDIEVRGVVSPKFYFQIPEILHLSRIENRVIDDQPFKIVVEKFQPSERYDNQDGVVIPFSGGVDSMFTLWSHLKERGIPEEFEITHGLFLHGFDIRFSEKEIYEWLREKYTQMFKDLGLDLVLARTNILQFSKFYLKFIYHQTSTLMSVILPLGKLINRVCKPSYDGYFASKADTKAALFDPLYSNETMEVVHHGAWLDRGDKIRVLSAWPKFHAYARVCINNTKRRNKFNCSRCEKCLRTMIILRIVGFEKKMTSFHFQGKYQEIVRWWLFSRNTGEHIKHFLKDIKKEKKLDLFLLLMFLYPLGAIKDRTYRYIVKLIPTKMMYQLKRKMFPYDDVVDYPV